MSELEQRCIDEYRRQEEIFLQAQKAGIESVILSCLASMNTINYLLEYDVSKLSDDDTKDHKEK